MPSPPAPTVTISPVPEQEPTLSQPTETPHLEPTSLPSSGGDHGSARLQSPPTITDVPPKGPARPLARPRINSLVNPAVSSASPLALLFQPIVVEEEAVADDHLDDFASPAKPPNILSYGPASRRRLVSIGPKRRGRTLAETSPGTSALNRWQLQGNRSHSPPRSDEGE